MIAIPKISKELIVNVDLTDSEYALLSEILEDKQTRMIREIDHTDSRDFRQMLRTNLETLEGSQRKLEQLKG